MWDLPAGITAAAKVTLPNASIKIANAFMVAFLLSFKMSVCNF